jgi:hypothetical protein
VNDTKTSVVKQSLRTGTVKQNLTVECCHSCGALPVDWVNNPWSELPWIVTLKDSGKWRFLIDQRSAENPDMFSGFKIDGRGSIGDRISQTTGAGGRLNLHRSFFVEDLPV